MAKKIVLTDNSGNKCYPVTRDECVKCGDRTLPEKFSELEGNTNFNDNNLYNSKLDKNDFLGSFKETQLCELTNGYSVFYFFSNKVITGNTYLISLKFKSKPSTIQNIYIQDKKGNILINPPLVSR